MSDSDLKIDKDKDCISLKFMDEFTIYDVNSYQKIINSLSLETIKTAKIDLQNLHFIDTAASIFIYNTKEMFIKNGIDVEILSTNDHISEMISLVENKKRDIPATDKKDELKIFGVIGKTAHEYMIGFFSFVSFLGKLFHSNMRYFFSIKNIRYKEIFFEINESGVKAFGIIALTSFLIGLVVAYQSSVQLKIYGANIFIVDMLGISIMRELAPLITAIVIAGRSGSAFTAQIGAMKITQELDAMQTMGFDPYMFLVLPRIIALMIVLPILIFLADIMGIFGGMLVANLDLGISAKLFIERFSEVIAAKHFFVGLFKGPFFAFLIASIGIYRGMMVKDDTQSIGFNTTKSVVEAIFAVIVCDAFFSIIFTNLGI